MMFDYLCYHLSKFNHEKHLPRVEIDTPVNNLSYIKKNSFFNEI